MKTTKTGGFEEWGDDVSVRLFVFAQAPEAVPDDSEKPASNTETD
jgi:hypothetical protein